MSYKIALTGRFEKALRRLAKKYPSLKTDFARFCNDLATNPTKGVALGNACFKIRFALSDKAKGKSAGARVIYYLYVQANTVYLLALYDKSEQETISSREIKTIVASLDLGDDV